MGAANQFEKITENPQILPILPFKMIDRRVRTA